MHSWGTVTPAARIIDRRAAWQEALSSIQAQPLTYCPDFPEIARKWNEWWQFKATKPLIVAQVEKDRTIRWDKAFDLLHQPEEWVRLRRQQVEQTAYFGEALPFVRVDIGPVAMGAMLGAPLRFAEIEQTSWQTPIIDSWEDAPELAVDEKNTWFQRILHLTEMLAQDADGNYLVCLPDLTGAIDAIANLRGTQNLCFDLFEQRPAILKAASQAVDAWEMVFTRLYDVVLGAGAGILQWVSCWADRPFTVPTCDFNALIGNEDFKAICMPSLKEQARRAGLCVIHLDGPDAARHAKILAEDADISALQYTPGEGTPSALAKLPMFRMIQSLRVPLYIECPASEARELLQALDPRGCAIRVSGLHSQQEAQELLDWRDQFDSFDFKIGAVI